MTSSPKTSLKLSEPVILLFGNAVYAQMCAQAKSPGDNSVVLLEKIDEKGNNPLQQWQFGSDGRIYLYTPATPQKYCLTFTPPAQNGAPAVVNATDQTDQNQTWFWANVHTYLENNGASSPNGPVYVLDNSGGQVTPGNKIQIWQMNNNNTQTWVAESVSALRVALQD